MGPENWMRIAQWIDAKRVELERRLTRWPDLNDLIRDVVVADHQGIDTAPDLPDQEIALRTLLSEQLRLIRFSAERDADNEFYAQVRSSPITDTDRSSRTYLEFLSKYVTRSEIRDAIQNLRARQMTQPKAVSVNTVA